MKPQNHQNAQDDIESIAFDVWLSSPEGQAWLDDAEQEQEERQVLSVWEGW